ncbi:hypothetical protein LLG10_08360 [bacterium]|nr:hypothetical protein [bacterium]
MKLLFKSLLLYLLLPISFVYGVTPITFTVSELINGKQLYNNLVVQFQGEVIGQRLSKTDYVWVNIQDAEYNAIGAYMSREMSDLIQYYGTHKTRGDQVLIEGVYHTKCEEHGGDTDIHVLKLEILQIGSARDPDELNMNLVIGCCILFWVILYLFYRKKKKSQQASI